MLIINMIAKLTYPLLIIPITISCLNAYGGELKSGNDISITSHEVIKIIESKNFKELSRFAEKSDEIRWINCGAHEGSLQHSTKRSIEMLSNYAKFGPILVNGNPDVVELNKTTNSVVLETEGWGGEYPYFVFSFEINKSDNRWKWFGVCYDAEPPLKYSQNKNIFARTYYRKPTVPRPGARIFQDRYALNARIREIIQLGAFDALSAYAVKHMVIFSECGQDVIVNENLEGEMVVPFNRVIDFLKRAKPTTNKLHISGSENIYTSGWLGDYPFLTFVIAETKNGWEWNQVVYCKTSKR